MDEWFQEIRECASREIWSRGVEIARGTGVEALETAEERALLRVRGGAGARPPRVALFFDDGGWDCDCGSAEDPCEHVAAAAIAWRRAQREGIALPAPTRDAATLLYELERAEGGLRLRRFAVRGSGEGATREAIESSLRAITRGRVSGPTFEADDADWEIEELLGDRHRDPVARGLLPALLRALRGRALRFEGRPIEVAPDPLRAVLVVEDVEGGFRLSLRNATRGAERLAPGVALRDDALHLVDDGALSGRERERFSRGHFVPNDHAEILAGELLPDLEGRITLDARSERLPVGTHRERPRILVRSEREGASLRVCADIVYGDPPRARLSGTPATLIALGGALPIRDSAEEARLAREVQRELALPVGSPVILGGDEALEVAQRLRDSGLPVVGKGHRDFFRTPPLRFELGEGEAYRPSFVSAETDGRGVSVSPAAVLAAWEQGQSTLALDGGGLAELPGPWLERHGRILAAFLDARAAASHDGGDSTSAPSASPAPPLFAAVDWALLCEAEGHAPPAAVQHFRERLERLFAQSDPGSAASSLPSDLQAVLRDYQRQGVEWLNTLREAQLGALLADDMGLGKTLQVLCALRGRTLVVAPTSVLPNWRDEAQRFRPGLRICTYHGSARQLDANAELTLTSYAILRRDLDVLNRRPWDVAVLDEAQAIKNPESQAARAAFALRAAWRVSLTGTPVENRLDELWSQLHFLNPGHMGPRRRFETRYAKPIESGDEAAGQELRRRIRPFVLRRLKGEVARELPPRSDLVVKVELDPGEREIYEALRAATRRDLADRFGAGDASAVAALDALLRLRQAACHADLVPGQHADRSSKIEVLVDLLETAAAENHKALVFSQWTGLLDRIEPHLRSASLGFVRLDGSTRDREAPVTAFGRPEGPPVFLISLRAGGTGLNLTAADHVFLIDPWWNPAVEEQAADRAHRIGQDKPVFVHRLVAAETVEERMLELQQRKLATAQSALRESGGAASLEREDLLGLLE